MYHRIVTLSEPIEIPGQATIRTIGLRVPRFADYMSIGMPFTWVEVGTGGYQQETPELLQAWIERLADIDPNFLALLGLRDTLELKGAIADFFREALAPAPSPSSSGPLPASSSSASAGPTGPSRI
ncbi:phage tail assembly protein [Methylocystis parvus]|uniref:Uncharacterized protein n=1 Tax=Methylocystis parvus TaxID=134 RepID=A0A6B8M839_9HYPH|nr:phage tail assembly protein [Methylocystis parvus]QGM97799.1 hypothetical protein F7D14_10185 [Methylocystis parvus]WBK01893.1 hypothetical protein MMG94_09395 [Methylocystis parvus OBBP]